MALKMAKPKLSAGKPQMRMAAQPANPQATKRQRGRAWMVRRAAWLSKYPLCRECELAGKVAAATQVDHIEPLFAGGADDESNFQSICDEHHEIKSAGESKARAKAGFSGRWG